MKKDLNNLLIERELTLQIADTIYKRKFGEREPDEADRKDFERLNEALNSIFEECAVCIQNMPIWKQIIKNDKTMGAPLTMKQLIAVVMTKLALMAVAEQNIDHNSKEYKMFQKIQNAYLTRDLAATTHQKILKKVLKNA